MKWLWVLGNDSWYSLTPQGMTVPVLGPLLSSWVLKQQLLSSHCNVHLLLRSTPLNPAVVVQLFVALISNKENYMSCSIYLQKRYLYKKLD